MINIVYGFLVKGSYLSGLHNSNLRIYLWVMLTSAARHWLRVQFEKILTLLLWEMKRTVKTLITFFSFPIKTFFN